MNATRGTVSVYVEYVIVVHGTVCVFVWVLVVVPSPPLPPLPPVAVTIAGF